MSEERDQDGQSTSLVSPQAYLYVVTAGGQGLELSWSPQTRDILVRGTTELFNGKILVASKALVPEDYFPTVISQLGEITRTVVQDMLKRTPSETHWRRLGERL